MSTFGRPAIHSGDGRILPPPIRKVTQKQRAANLAEQRHLAKERMTRRLKREIRRTTARRPAKLNKPLAKVSNAYARASAMLYEDPGMSDSARRLVLKLVQLARGRPGVSAYVAQLADYLGVSVRTIRYAQERARERGFLMIERTRRGSINDANIYHLTDIAVKPKTPYPRRGYQRARWTTELQDSASHNEPAKAGPPLSSPRGDQNASLPRMAKTSALMWGAHPPDTGQNEAINPLVGGEGAKIVPGKGPKRRRLLPESRPKP